MRSRVHTSTRASPSTSLNTAITTDSRPGMLWVEVEEVEEVVVAEEVGVGV